MSQQPPAKPGRQAPEKYPRLKPLWIAVFMDVLGFSLLIPILPYFMTLFSVSPIYIGLLLSANAVASFISGPLWGTLSDKYGRKPVLLICQTGTMAGFLVLGFSSQLWMLFLSRIIDGAFGGIFTVAKAVIADIVKPRELGRQMTNIGIVFTLSNIVGPVMGSALIGFGIIGPGMLAAFFCLIMLVQTAWFLKESAPVPLAKKSGKDPSTVPSMPLMKGYASERSIWKNPATRFLLVQWAFVSFSFMIYISSISLFASIRIGLSAQELGIFLAITGASQIVLRFAVFSPMLKKIGEKRTAIVGLAGYVVSYFFMGFVPDGLVGVVGLFVVLLGVTFGSVCSRGILTGFLSRSVSPRDQGKVQGFSSAIDSLAQIFGPIVGTAILTALPLFIFGLVPSLLSVAALSMVFKRVIFEQPIPEGAKHAPSQPTSMEVVPQRITAMRDGCTEHAEYAKACEE